MNYPQPYLQPYKGKSTRHTCPSCETKLSFTLYLSGDTHEPINSKVGKCNRESKCGYHYTPKQYFIDNPPLSPPLAGGRAGSLTPSPLERAGVRSGGLVGSIPFHFVQKSASYKSHFVRFLFDHFSDEQIRSVAENYALGATNSKEVIFWQIDITGKVRTGKIMQYNSETGKRIKHQSGAIDWVHNKLKKNGTLPEDFNLQQCFFGEHLLSIFPDKFVGIVESEKSAIIASCIMPDMIWLTAGNLNGLSIEKCQVLKRRDVMLYPDLGAFEKWDEKAQMLNSLSLSQFGEGSGVKFKISISSLLEDEATFIDRANGLDIADFIITELKFSISSKSGGSGKVFPEVQSYFSPTLQALIQKNKTLNILISRLNLIEI